MKKRHVRPQWQYIFAVTFTVCISAALFMGLGRSSPACTGCDVIILDIDILRKDALGCENPQPIAPNICAYMKSGFSFNNHIAHNDGTLASVVSAITSRYPLTHGMWFPPVLDIPKGIQSLPEIVKTRGYHTYFTAKFTTPPQINTRWFDSFLPIPKLREYLADRPKNAAPRLVYVYFEDQHFPYLFKNKLSWDESDLKDVTTDDRLRNLPKTAIEYNDALASYIGKHYRELFTPDTILKNPQVFEGNPATRTDDIFRFYRTIMLERKTTPSDYVDITWMPQYKAVLDFIDYANPKHAEYLHLRYLAILKAFDEELAPLLSLLASPDVRKRTVVILKSDHGEEFMEHGNFAHYNDLYQELIHIPFAIVAPTVRTGSTLHMSQDIDMAPTVLDLLGLPPMPGAQGKSLLPVIRFNKAVNSYQIAQKNYEQTSSIRIGKWKLIMKDRAPFALFDLESDPQEKSSRMKEKPEIVSQLLDTYIRETVKLPKFQPVPAQ